MYRVVIVVLVTVIGIGVLTATRAVAAKRPASRQDAEPFGRLKERAQAARSGDHTALRMFTDEVFDSALPPNAAKTLRDRVFKAEVAFREGRHQGISERQFVDVVNGELDRFGGPEHFRTSTEQVRSLRMRWRRVVPDLGFSATPGAPDVMAPTEMALIGLKLALLKMWYPNYQVQSEQSEHRSEIAASAQTQGVQSGNIAASLRGEMRNAKEPDFRRSIVRSLSDDYSAGTLVAHHVLDLLGLPR